MSITFPRRSRSAGTVSPPGWRRASHADAEVTAMADVPVYVSHAGDPMAPRRDGPITLVGPSRVQSHVRVSGGIEVADGGTALVLWISGELDVASRDPVELAVMAAIDSIGSVILDLAELTFCDSNGVAMLVTAHQKATANGGCIAVRHALPHVRRVLEVADLDGMLSLID